MAGGGGTPERMGQLMPSVMGVMKPSPRTFRAVMGMNNAITFGGSCLGRREEELISTVVSALNDCSSSFKLVSSVASHRDGNGFL